ncbi:MAG: LD-carboxypeptidase [Candidatus Latescibacterota bacterium]|nr:LD-carboxypeptidase [Candidatus Latescibacterota bacterium]
MKALQEGDTIGVVAPASPVTVQCMQPAVAWIESLGYRVRLGNAIGKRHRFLAGTDEERSQDILDMFSDDAVQAIFTARGGYGSSRILDLIDWSILRANRKPFIGFSDTTALQMAMYIKAGIVSFTGLALLSDAAEGAPPKEIEDDLLRVLRAGVFEPFTGLSRGLPLSGTLVGGCLSLVTHLVGTPYLPDLKGHILILEDVGESPYRVDRLLTQLILSKILERAAAVMLGTFRACSGDEEDGSIEDVLFDFASRCPCPVISGLHYGHGPTRRILPVGGQASIENGIMKLESLV